MFAISNFCSLFIQVKHVMSIFLLLGPVEVKKDWPGSGHGFLVQSIWIPKAPQLKSLFS